MRFLRKRVEESVYYLFHGYFPDVELFPSWSYIHVTEKDPKEILFGPTEATYSQRGVMQPIYGVCVEN